MSIIEIDTDRQTKNMNMLARILIHTLLVAMI